MKHITEVLKIINAASCRDWPKVASWAEQLVVKLELAGETPSANRVRRLLVRSGSRFQSIGNGTSSHMMPAGSDGRCQLLDEETFDETNTPVVCLEQKVKGTVEQFIRYVEARDLLISRGVGISPSLIMDGPPGCGKTELGRWVAARLGLPLLTARIDGLISSYLGNTAKHVRQIFDHAMARPCVLFLDEFDGLAKMRDDRNEVGELKRTVVSVLQCIDALDGQTVMLAATNHEHLLDPAVWRRFAYHVRIELPSEAVRAQLLGLFLGDFAGALAVAHLAAASAGLNGGVLRQVCDDCKRDAVIDGRTEIDLAVAGERVRQAQSQIRDAAKGG